MRSALRAVNRALVWILIVPIRFYQLAISPMTPPSCKFHPSCSAYAVGSLQRHGPAKGLVLTVYRLGRCHPWQAGGLDPVPAKGRWSPDITAAGETVIPLLDLRRARPAVDDLSSSNDQLAA